PPADMAQCLVARTRQAALALVQDGDIRLPLEIVEAAVAAIRNDCQDGLNGLVLRTDAGKRKWQIPPTVLDSQDGGNRRRIARRSRPAQPCPTPARQAG